MIHLNIKHSNIKHSNIKYSNIEHSNRKDRQFNIPFASALLLLTILLAGFAPAKKALAAEPKLSEKSITLVQNYEDYIIRFKNIEDDAPLTFSSSDETIASVDETGIISPVGIGNAVITVTIDQDGETYTRKLKVDVRAPYYDVIESGEGCHIGESITFAIAEYGYDEEAQWSIVGSDLARLEPMTKTSARLTGLADGDVVVSVLSRGVKTSFEVRILEGAGRIFVVSPKTKPFEGKYTNYSSYNENTKNYYMLKSYLSELDKLGGGTLILKKGTYIVTNILCVPSNTKVLLLDGALISKSYTTGTSLLPANRSIFHTVSYTNYDKYQGGNKHVGLSGYDGSRNIKIMGEGNAAIDLNGLNTCAIVMCHTKDVEVSGLQFLNMNTNHFIEIDAANNVTIKNCLFKGFVASGTGRKEAINVDTPDVVTGGFNQDWSSYDCTPVKNLTIKDNVFMDLESAIGTHKYSGGYVHTNITITGNLFYDMTAYGIRCMNWDKVTITNNSFCNRKNFEDDVDGVILNGVTNPKITKNRFEGITYAIDAYHWRNTGYGKEYPAIYNEFTEEDFKEFSMNYVKDMDFNYICYCPKMNKKGTEPNCDVVEEHPIDPGYLL